MQLQLASGFGHKFLALPWPDLLAPWLSTRQDSSARPLPFVVSTETTEEPWKSGSGTPAAVVDRSQWLTAPGLAARGRGLAVFVGASDSRSHVAIATVKDASGAGADASGGRQRLIRCAVGAPAGLIRS